MRRRRKSNFRFVFFVYVCVLIVACAAALIYVNSALREYEAEHPRHLVDEALELLRSESADGSLWSKDTTPNMTAGKFESDKDIKAEFTRLINGDVTYSHRTQVNETDCRYGIIADGFEIAEVILRETGEPKQKLAIITIQDYELVSYAPITHSYTLAVPSFVKVGEDITVTVNGTVLDATDFVSDNVKGTHTATLDGINLKPEISITDSKGNTSVVRLPESADGELEFDATLYDLILPEELSVSLDSEKLEGTPTDDGRLAYSIRLAKKAEVVISDLYGNSISYNGASGIPITYTTIMTNDGHSVKVDGKDIPSEAVEIAVNPDFATFAEYVPDLPKRPIYSIVVLKEDADISVTDASGNAIEIDPKNKFIDITGSADGESTDTVPEDIAVEINVLSVLESWSLFMSNDLDFYTLSKSLIEGSYQYNVANTYNNSVDKNFMSVHTLLDPPFTEESVTNFVRITDNCFSVDISFVKHMYLNSNQQMDDSMNERCYFVKHDSTNDYVDNPTWKLVGMKEIVNDGK